MLKWKPIQSSVSKEAVNLLAVATALSVVCVFLRIALVWTSFISVRESFWTVRRGFYSSYVDLAVVWSVTALALLILAASPKRGKPTVFYLYLAFAIASVVFACVNFTAVRILGGSLTYQWLYYADLFKSVTAHASIKAAVNAQTIIVWALSFGLFVASVYFFATLFQHINRRGLMLLVTASGFVALASIIGISERKIGNSDAAQMVSTNPWVELITTALAAQNSELTQLSGLPEPPSLPMPSDMPDILPADFHHAGIKNVLIVVMESVGAKALSFKEQNGASVTPEIDTYAGSTISFKNFYAHSPMSSKSMYSMLTGRYPEFTFEAETTRFRGAPLQTLSGVLKPKGYRTGFFMAGDIEFQGNGDFISQSGFDTHLDRRGIPCLVATYKAATVDWPYLDAIDDGCVAKQLTTWIAADEAAPFLAIMWTNNTHYPYFRAVEEAPKFNTGDFEKDKYLAALQTSDAAIGSVLSYLKNRNLLDSTLVLVLGDHGEAFGEHGWRIHGSDIYEEQVHIPLLMINPHIAGRQSEELGGLSDLAPTILHILGMKSDKPWEGRSLFDPNRPKRLFVFAPNQSMTAGYREGFMKYTLVLSRNKASVFDLDADPGETRNLADSASGDFIRKQIAAWLRDRKRFSASTAAH